MFHKGKNTSKLEKKPKICLMKKDDPVVHCLLTFFQNLETVGVPKKEK